MVSLFGIKCSGTSLHNITGSIEFGALTTQPEFVQTRAVSIGIPSLKLTRHYRVSATQAGETGGLREAAEFDCHLTRSLNLIYRTRYARGTHISFISRIK